MQENQEPGSMIREAAFELARLNSAPCLAFVSCIHRDDVVPVLDQLGEHRGGTLQLLLWSHGGHIDEAFMLIGLLRQRFEKLVVHVPLCARSAAALVCLAADELVMGELASLGPLDGQWNGDASSDHPGSSLLAPFKALEQLRTESVALFDALLDAVVRRTNLRPAEAADKAADLTGSLLSNLYSRIDPVSLGKAARGLQAGSAYAERILERHRPGLWAEAGQPLVERLVQGYPSHDFVIDCVEAAGMGLATRAPVEAERVLFDRIATSLLRCNESIRVIELVLPAGPGSAERSPGKVDPGTREQVA